jgi:shikimate kinase
MEVIIFLCGMPGSGKTHIGRNVANKFSYHFTDLDAFIEVESGLSPEAWIRLKGEAVFREKEAYYLRSLRLEKKHIIACGGGTPCFYNNLQYMSNHGTPIFIDVDPRTLLERLSISSEEKKRPLLKDSGLPLAQTLVKLWERRKPFFLKIPHWFSDTIELEDFIRDSFENKSNDNI